jgi:hypothetical protein
MDTPALVIGHQHDLNHPFSDAGMLAAELPNARLFQASSLIELRITPARLTGEIAAFLDDCWRPRRARRRAAASETAASRYPHGLMSSRQEEKEKRRREREEREQAERAAASRRKRIWFVFAGLISAVIVAGGVALAAGTIGSGDDGSGAAKTPGGDTAAIPAVQETDLTKAAAAARSRATRTATCRSRATPTRTGLWRPARRTCRPRATTRRSGART